MIHHKYLQINIVEHCTLRCRGCVTYSEYSPPIFYSVDNFKKDIFRLTKVLKTDVLFFLGGEALLHPDIVKFLTIAKESKIAKEIKVLTNGQLLRKQSDQFFAFVDTIEVSVYPSTIIDYDKVFALLEEKSKVHNFKIERTEWPNFIEGIDIPYRQTPEETQQVFNRCGAHLITSKCHGILNGYYYKCYKPYRQARLMKDNNIEIIDDFISEDGLYLHDDNLEERLNEYLTLQKPLKTCYYCKGWDKRDINVIHDPAYTLDWKPHEQLPRKRPEGYPFNMAIKREI